VSTPTPVTPTPEQPNPVVTAISVAVTNIGNAVVAFGVFNNTTAAAIEVAVVGVVSAAFIVANELRHKTNTSKA
jgi:hypothetical protein